MVRKDQVPGPKGKSDILIICGLLLKPIQTLNIAPIEKNTI